MSWISLSMTSEENCKWSFNLNHNSVLYRVFFFTDPAQKLPSVEDCKVPTKKGKARPTFTFLLGILQSSTLRTVRAGAVKRPPCMICCAVKDSFNTNRQVCSLLPSIKPTLKKVSKYENKFAKLQKKVSLCSELNFNLYLYLIFRPLSSASEPSWRLWRRKSLPWTRARQRQVNSHFSSQPEQSILQLVVFHLFMLVHYQGDVSANLLTRHSLVSFIHPCRDFAKTIHYTYLYLLIGQRNHNGLWYSLSEKPSY